MPSASSDCASCCVKHNLQSGYWVHIVYCEVWKWASVRFCTYQHPVCVHFIEMLHICNSKSLPVVCWVCGGFSISLFKVKERRGLKKVRQFHTRGFIFFQLDISLFWCITVKKKKKIISVGGLLIDELTWGYVGKVFDESVQPLGLLPLKTCYIKASKTRQYLGNSHACPWPHVITASHAHWHNLEIIRSQMRSRGVVLSTIFALPVYFPLLIQLWFTCDIFIKALLAILTPLFHTFHTPSLYTVRSEWIGLHNILITITSLL